MFVSKHNCVFKIGQTKRAGTSGDIVRQACSLVEIWSTVHDADDDAADDDDDDDNDDDYLVIEMLEQPGRE